MTHTVDRDSLLGGLSDDDVMYDHPVSMTGEPMDPVLFVRWDAILAALPEPEVFDEADDMCPNCVTPWKCNGPHLSEQTVVARRAAALPETPGIDPLQEALAEAHWALVNWCNRSDEAYLALLDRIEPLVDADAAERADAALAETPAPYCIEGHPTYVPGCSDAAELARYYAEAVKAAKPRTFSQYAGATDMDGLPWCPSGYAQRYHGVCCDCSALTYSTGSPPSVTSRAWNGTMDEPWGDA